MTASAEQILPNEQSELQAQTALVERIRARAREIWLQRGGPESADTDWMADWLQAKEEILLSRSH